MLQNIKREQSQGPVTFSRVYKIVLTFDEIRDLRQNLGIGSSRLAQLFSEKFIPALMSEIFKQLKKSDDAPNAVLKVPTRSGKQADDGGTTDGASRFDGDETDKQTSAVNNDEEDEPSDQEREIQDEFNAELDGNTKISKVVRGYEDADQESQASELPRAPLQDNQLDPEDKDSKDSAMEEKATAERRKAQGVDKYTKYSECHAKYRRNLKAIDFDERLNTATVELTFPLDVKKALMLTLVEQSLAKVLVRSVPQIEKCTLIRPKKEGEEPQLVVQGTNFDAFYPHQDIIDVNTMETNHSYALKAKYGVEAMRANIMKEVQMVFGVYGIQVDKRHLSLISDFMTFNGDYRAFNRIGMEESSSPFLKMSYETTMKYLVAACQANETDDMSSPSSAIVLGQVPRLGTGMFDLIQASTAAR